MSSIIHEIISIQFHKATKKTKLDQRKHPPSSILHGHSYYYNMEDEMMTDDSGRQSLAEHFAGNKTMKSVVHARKDGLASFPVVF